MHPSRTINRHLPWGLKLASPVLLACYAWVARASAYSAEVASLAVTMVLLSLARRQTSLRNVLIIWGLTSCLGWALAGATWLLAPRTGPWWFWAFLTAQALMVASQDIREERS